MRTDKKNRVVSLKRTRTRWGCLLILFVTIGLLCEGCYELLVFLDDRDRLIASGSLEIDKSMITDLDYIFISKELLQNLNWQPEHSQVRYISRQFECAQAVNPPSKRLLIFSKGYNISLFGYDSHDAFLEMDGNTGQVSYELFDNAVIGPSFIKEKGQTYDLESITIDSSLALINAEASGGKTFRNRVDNQCSISVSLSRHSPHWSVRYRLHDYSHEKILEVQVDVFTGEVTQIMD